MKKNIFIIFMALALSTHANAQQNDIKWSLNTRLWTTNYWSTLIFGLASETLKQFAFKTDEKDSTWVDCVIPTADIVFPIGMGKKGFEGVGDIYGPYHYAWGNPFKHLGDYAFGVDASFMPSTIGFYAGAYFKSQEIVFKQTDDNLRGFYFQPRAGLIVGGKDKSLEAGVFYDVVTGCGGSIANTNKDMLKGGLGLDFALSYTHKDRRERSLLQFSMPLHNFFDTSYPGQSGLKRKVGYIMLTERIFL